jgi:O-antigen ligase
MTHRPHLRAVRLAEGLLVLAVAWGVFAFGAVYGWGYWPLIATSPIVAVLAVVSTRGSRRNVSPERSVTTSLVVFAAAAAVQLVPIRLTTLGAVAPQTLGLLRQMNPAVATGALRTHSLSVAPDATAVGLCLFAAMATLALSSTVVFSLRGARPFARVLVVVGAAVAIVGIVQQPLFTGRIYGFWTPVGGTPYGPFVNRNHFAGWMLMALPVTLGVFLGEVTRAMRDVRATWRDRLLWFSSTEASRLLLVAVAAIVMALALVLTMSRSGMTALALACGLTAAFVGRRERIRGRGGVAVACLLVLIVVVAGWAGPAAIAARFSEGQAADLDGRFGAWADANDVRRHFPITGTGLNTYGVAMVLYQRHDRSHRYTEAHNDYLQLAAEGGWLLTIPAACALVAFVRVVRRRLVDEVSAAAYWLRVGAVTGIAAIALQESVEFSLQMPGNAALFAILCGIALHRTPSRRSEIPAPSAHPTAS